MAIHLFPLGRFVAGLGVAISSAMSSPVYLVDSSGLDASATGSDATKYPSIQKAVDAGLKNPGKEPVVIELRSGIHRLSQPVRLDSAKLGGLEGGLVFRASDGAEPVISGGIEITKWVPHDEANGIWKAELAGPSPSRSLIVNGVRAVRARSAYGLTNPEINEAGYVSKNPEMARWKNPRQIEMVYRAIWTNPRCRVSSIAEEGDGVRIEMVQPGWKFCRTKGITGVKDPWYIENAYELLDSPGEWYLDETGAVGGKAWTIYYKPQPWENMAETMAVLPLLENLFVFEGTPDKPVADITIEGITFADTAWLRPNSERGHPDAQNNVIRESHKDGIEFVGEGAALRFVNSRGIVIRDCRFRHLGGIGVLMTGGARDNKIIGNSFVDIAATGIQIGDYLDWPKPESPNNPSVADPGMQISGIQIKNNFLWRCGVEYRSATAIALTFPIDSEISHNEIWHMPYIGFHMGWSWIRIDSSNTAGNVIANNHIENVMVELADGAGIYTLGASNSKERPNILTGNVIRRSRWGHGMYFDEGSCFFNGDRNATLDALDFNIKVNGPTSNNIQITNHYATNQRNSITEGTKDIRIDPAIIVSDANQAEVDKIRASAGLEKEYEHLRMVIRDPYFLEAEEADLVMPARTGSGLGGGTHSYEGIGYVDGIGNGPGGEIKFAFEMSAPGERTLSVRYSLTETLPDGITITVNDQAPMVFKPGQTGNISNWKTWSTEVELREGANTITLSDPEGKGRGLLVDRITLLPVKEQ